MTGLVYVLLIAVAAAADAAAAALLHVLVIVAAILLGLGVAGLAGLLAFRVRRRLGGAARVRSPLPWMARAAPDTLS